MKFSHITLESIHNEQNKKQTGRVKKLNKILINIMNKNYLSLMNLGLVHIRKSKDTGDFKKALKHRLK
ncbi:hypothetical protein [Wolbachia endosymbiont of Litomosoides sigmodontis]|uniref:hypothetical protein n=1 Tax=Wolbachia endosymbiont of Litomosoides sigmodontis TaxID=80850 RepID=UPI002671392D|nr:hypothetical protein [Wolbachia endosymbiont of Litomosoides sigmodontis]